jgi:PRTRC genetic system protein E
MFKELSPLLRQRAVLLTVTRLEEDEIRVNIIPKKLKESENNALTTALKVTGTAEELDRELPSAIVNYVSSYLQMKNSLEKSQAEMDEAVKAAQAEAKAKAKIAVKKDTSKPDTAKAAVAADPAELARSKPATTGSLFDVPAAIASPLAHATQTDEEEEILAEVSEEGQAEEDEELDAVI